MSQRQRDSSVYKPLLKLSRTPYAHESRSLLPTHAMAARAGVERAICNRQEDAAPAHDLPVGFCSNRHEHDVYAERAEDVSIARVARRRHRHTVAWIEGSCLPCVQKVRTTQCVCCRRRAKLSATATGIQVKQRAGMLTFIPCWWRRRKEIRWEGESSRSAARRRKKYSNNSRSKERATRRNTGEDNHEGAAAACCDGDIVEADVDLIFFFVMLGKSLSQRPSCITEGPDSIVRVAKMSVSIAQSQQLFDRQ